MTAPAYAPSPIPSPAPPVLALVPPVAGIVGTPQQEAFWRAILEGKSHIVLSARAGSGKSFSICHGARLALDKWPNLSIGFCAFNRAIADELKAKIPAKAEADTMHGLGFRALTDYLGKKPKVEDDKTRILLRDLLNPDELDARKRVPRPLGKAVAELVSKCKSYLLEGTAADIAFICNRHEVELEPNRASKASKGLPLTPAEREADAKFKARVIELIPRVLERCKELISVVDYDDMIWLLCVLDIPVPTFQLLFIDEAQDLNPARQQLAFLMCPHPGRLIIVGDPKQAIYGFTGADPQSMANMRKRMDATSRGSIELPLTWTRRCPRTVVKLAQRLVPDLEAMPEAPEGLVEEVAAKDAATLMQPGHMVLCRTNAPLVGLAHQLLRAEKKALLKGKDLSKPIIELMDALGESDVKMMGDALKRFRTVEVDRLTDANKSPQQITAFEDKCDTLEVLMEGCSNRFEIEAKIRRIFQEKDPEGAVILTSVHSSKGLEADTVWILRKDLMPHPATVKRGRADDLEQEQNLEYVACTRAMRRLVFVVPVETPKETAPTVETKPQESQTPVLYAPADESEKCKCGTSLEYLRDFFGPEMQGHVSKCRDCGGEMHSSEDSSVCVTCGVGSQLIDPDPGALAEAAEGAAPYPSNIRTFSSFDWKEQVRELLVEARRKVPTDQWELDDAIEKALGAIQR